MVVRSSWVGYGSFAVPSRVVLLCCAVKGAKGSSATGDSLLVVGCSSYAPPALSCPPTHSSRKGFTKDCSSFWQSCDPMLLPRRARGVCSTTRRGAMRCLHILRRPLRFRLATRTRSSCLRERSGRCLCLLASSPTPAFFRWVGVLFPCVLLPPCHLIMIIKHLLSSKRCVKDCEHTRRLAFRFFLVCGCRSFFMGAIPIAATRPLLACRKSEAVFSVRAIAAFGGGLTWNVCGAGQNFSPAESSESSFHYSCNRH